MYSKEPNLTLSNLKGRKYEVGRSDKKSSHQNNTLQEISGTSPKRKMEQRTSSTFSRWVSWSVPCSNHFNKNLSWWFKKNVLLVKYTMALSKKRLKVTHVELDQWKVKTFLTEMIKVCVADGKPQGWASWPLELVSMAGHVLTHSK